MPLKTRGIVIKGENYFKLLLKYCISQAMLKNKYYYNKYTAYIKIVLANRKSIISSKRDKKLDLYITYKTCFVH
jgi:hypothetical protein